MKLTGYALVALGAIMVAYTIVTNLFVDAGRVDPLNGQRADNTYWFVLIPAAISVAAGGWLIYTGEKGYKETYDMRRQQS